MSLRTFALLLLAAVSGLFMWLCPPQSMYTRYRFCWLFATVGAFCGSWLLDGDRGSR